MMTNHESIGETKDDGSELSDNDGNTYAKKFAVVVLFLCRIQSISHYYSLLLLLRVQRYEKRVNIAWCQQKNTSD